LLRSGEVLVVGGATQRGWYPQATVEGYIEGAAAWRPLAPLAEARRSHTATVLDDWKVLEHQSG
jgi:hypothetical protein